MEDGLILSKRGIEYASLSQDSSSGRLYHSPAKPPDPDPPFSYGRSWQV